MAGSHRPYTELLSNSEQKIQHPTKQRQTERQRKKENNNNNRRAELRAEAENKNTAQHRENSSQTTKNFFLKSASTPKINKSAWKQKRASRRRALSCSYWSLVFRDAREHDKGERERERETYSDG
jgi:hypothetical protein